MTRNLFSSWALSWVVIYVDIRKTFCSVLVEEVVGTVMGRSDRAKVMARLGWTGFEQHQLEATLQERQHETALHGMAPDFAAMLADWHQTNWFTIFLRTASSLRTSHIFMRVTYTHGSSS